MFVPINLFLVMYKLIFNEHFFPTTIFLVALINPISAVFMPGLQRWRIFPTKVTVAHRLTSVNPVEYIISLC